MRNAIHPVDVHVIGDTSERNARTAILTSTMVVVCVKVSGFFLIASSLDYVEIRSLGINNKCLVVELLLITDMK